MKFQMALRYGIIAAASPRMAPEKSADSQIHPSDRTVPAECLEGVLRASWGESARWRFQRTDAHLVESYEKDERRYGYLPDDSARSVCVHLFIFWIAAPIEANISLYDIISLPL